MIEEEDEGAEDDDDCEDYGIEGNTEAPYSAYFDLNKQMKNA